MSLTDRDRGRLVSQAKRQGREWAQSAWASGARLPGVDWDSLLKAFRALHEPALGAFASELAETALAAAKAELGSLASQEARTSGPIQRVTKFERVGRHGRPETTAIVTRSSEWDLPSDRAQAIALVDAIHQAEVALHSIPAVGAHALARDEILGAVDRRDPWAYVATIQRLAGDLRRAVEEAA